MKHGLWVAAVLFGTSPQGAGNVFQQGAGPDFLVVVDAVKFRTHVPSASHTWNMVTAPAGFAGTGAMQAMPDTATSNDTNYATLSPRLDFVVNFVTPGVHYVWIRGYGQGGQADSVHVGLDGAPTTTGERITGFTPAYTWQRQMAHLTGGARVDVSTTGIHTVNLWMREDAFVADRILLTPNASYAGVTQGGTMAGPPQSAQGPDPRPGPPSGLTATGGPFSVTLRWTPGSQASSTTVLGSGTPGGPYAPVASGVTGTTYTHGGLTAGVTYHYVVQSVNSLGVSGYSNEASATPSAPPRTNDHEEGLWNSRCALGASGPAFPGWVFGAACLLVAGVWMRARR